MGRDRRGVWTGGCDWGCGPAGVPRDGKLLLLNAVDDLFHFAPHKVYGVK